MKMNMAVYLKSIMQPVLWCSVSKLNNVLQAEHALHKVVFA